MSNEGELFIADVNPLTVMKPKYEVHRFRGRQSSGLGITLCGIEQESRSQPWIWIRDASIQAFADELPRCEKCDELEEEME